MESLWPVVRGVTGPITGALFGFIRRPRCWVGAGSAERPSEDARWSRRSTVKFTSVFLGPRTRADVFGEIHRDFYSTYLSIGRKIRERVRGSQPFASPRPFDDGIGLCIYLPRWLRSSPGCSAGVPSTREATNGRKVSIGRVATTLRAASEIDAKACKLRIEGGEYSGLLPSITT